MSKSFIQEIEKRRTFGIISHPDAGKTTLTEKLLLFGGAIQMAGAIKARKAARHATSDWMKVEQERGISVTTSVMKFGHRDCEINLLDTPGHQDFAEDIYRTLTAVDSVIVVIDVAKGVEAQTEKLVEVCRMRKTPIIVFINKLDRTGADFYADVDSIVERLGAKPLVMQLPVGAEADFHGVVDLVDSQRIIVRVGAEGRETRVAGELQHCRAHRPARAVDQNALPRLNPRNAMQHLVGRHRRQDHRQRVRVRDAARGLDRGPVGELPRTGGRSAAGAGFPLRPVFPAGRRGTRSPGHAADRRRPG